MTEDEVLQLCAKISGETGIEMSLEGIYRWIAFLPSKVKSTRPVAARFLDPRLLIIEQVLSCEIDEYSVGTRASFR